MEKRQGHRRQNIEHTPYELNIVFMRNPPCAIVPKEKLNIYSCVRHPTYMCTHEPDPIYHSDANIFNGSQKVFVGYEIPEIFAREICVKDARE